MEHQYKHPVINRSFFTKPIYKETTIQDGDSQVSKTVNYDQRLGCLHRHPQSRKYLRFVYEDQIYQFTTLPFGMPLSPWIFTKLMDIIASHLCQLAISVFPYLDNLLIRDLICNRGDLICNRLLSQTIYCLQIVQSLGFIPNLKKSD